MKKVTQMKTVQETLREMDKEELMRQFFYEHPSKLDNFDDDLTIAQAKERANKVIGKYIERLETMEVKPNDRQMIFYMYEYLGSYKLNQYRGLSTVADLQEKGVEAPNYGIEYTSQEEVMGYWVADTEMTQYYLNDLMVEIMWDASFFGVKQEKLPEAIKELEEADKEIDEGLEESFNSYEEFEDFLYGDEPRPPKLSKEDSAEKQKIIQTVNHLHKKFHHHLQQKEIDQILKEFSQRIRYKNER